MKVLAAIEVEVDFFHQPFEPAETGPEAQYPGCEESIEIGQVWIGSAEISEQLTPADLASVHDAVWEAIHD